MNSDIVHNQHGFIGSCSAQTNLVPFIDSVSQILDRGGEVDVVYIDFSGAYDRVNNFLFMKKFEGIWIARLVV